MVLFAHAGHWTVWILYAVPVIAVVIAAYTSSVKTRRFEAEDGAGNEPPADPPDRPGG